MFNRNDLINLRMLLKRGNYAGLEEAQVAVYLDHKITQQLTELSLQEKIQDGRYVQNNDQPSPASGQ